MSEPNWIQALAADLHAARQRIAELEARILELETVTEEKVGAAPGEHCVVQPWDGQGYAVIETRSSGVNPSNGMIAYFNRRIHESKEAAKARADAFAALMAGR